jgi:hypothetical protein
MLDLMIAESGHDALAHLLAHVAVELVCLITARIELVVQLVAHQLCGAKDQAELYVLDVDQAAEHLDLRAAIHP